MKPCEQLFITNTTNLLLAKIPALQHCV